MVFRWLALLALSGLPLAAQEAGLVRVSDSWRYFKGTNAPSAPASAWRQPAFDDSTWGTATGAFIVGQYYEENSLLTDMPAHYLSVFFRRKFALADPATVRWLLLRI